MMAYHMKMLPDKHHSCICKKLDFQRSKQKQSLKFIPISRERMIDFLKKKGYSFKDLYFIIKNFIYY